MSGSSTEALRDLVRSQRIASLGTLHQGEPYVSMVPYAVLPDGSGLVVHVSALAAHTRDMLARPRVSAQAVTLRPEAFMAALTGV